MKKKILLVILAVSLSLGVFRINKDTKTPKNVLAVGDLEVTYLGIPLGDPIFEVTNMLPGDTEDRDVDVSNNGSVPHFISVKGVKTGGIGGPPLLEDVLGIVITEGASVLYSDTLANFFSDSADPNGIPLSIVNDGASTTYNFKVTFPDSAGNEFQEKSVIFDLVFGIITGENLVINEVYYDVDAAHGFDSPKDRGILAIGANDVTIIISDNGAGSVNTAKVKLKDVCKVIQKNEANINNLVNIFGNTGGNNAGGNTGGNTNINTGRFGALLNLFNFLNQSNTASCGKKLGQNHEWIEIYNPTDHEISLKNWTLTDNSGNPVIIHGNKKVAAGGFALISKDSSVWRFWDEDRDAKKVELGRQIGDGLDDEGDHILLKNPDSEIVDFVAWGDDTFDWNPAVPLVTLGSSIERIVPGFDTDLPSDWGEQTSPTPGS